MNYYLEKFEKEQDQKYKYQTKSKKIKLIEKQAVEKIVERIIAKSESSEPLKVTLNELKLLEKYRIGKK